MRISYFLFLFAIVGCASSRPDHYTEYVKNVSSVEPISAVDLRLPDTGPIRFFGAVDYDKLSAGQLNTLYPAPNAGVFLVSVLTHAAIAESSKNGEKSSQQTEADKVLSAYQDQIQFIFPFDLKKSAQDHMGKLASPVSITDGADSSATWLLMSNPIFFMAADERSIAVVNKVTIYKAGQTEQPIYQNMIETVSDAAPEKSPQSYWKDNANPIFQDTVKNLFNKSIELAMRDATLSLSDESVQDSTIHYSKSGKTLFERGKRISTNCGHITIRTLRGWIKWVPMTDSERQSNTSCVSST